jgi:hypothetical protein
MLVRLRRLSHDDFFLLGRVSKVNPWAGMILGQAMQRAELSSAVWTLEREKRLLPAFLTLHSCRAPSLPFHRYDLYIFLEFSPLALTGADVESVHAKS